MTNLLPPFQLNTIEWYEKFNNLKLPELLRNHLTQVSRNIIWTIVGIGTREDGNTINLINEFNDIVFHFDCCLYPVGNFNSKLYLPDDDDIICTDFLYDYDISLYKYSSDLLVSDNEMFTMDPYYYKVYDHNLEKEFQIPFGTILIGTYISKYITVSYKPMKKQPFEYDSIVMVVRGDCIGTIWKSTEICSRIAFKKIPEQSTLNKIEIWQ